MGAGRSKLDIDIIPGIVNLQSNVLEIPRFHLFSHNPGHAIAAKTDEAQIKAGYFVDSTHPQLQDPPVESNGFSGVSDNQIYYERTIGAGQKAQMLVDFHGESSFEIYVNKTYHLASNITIDKFYSVGWYLRDLIQYCLLQNGYTLLHSACFEYNDQGILIIALSDVGKSTTTMNFIQKGAKYVAEDLSVTDGEYIYTCPYTFGPGDISRYKNTLAANVYNKAHRAFPLLGHVISAPGTVFDLVESEDILQKTKADQVFVLTKGRKQQRDVTSEQAARMALSQNRAELLYHASPMLSISEFIDINIDVFSAVEKEEEIISDLFQRTCNIIQLSGTPEYFEEIIESKSGQ